MASKTPPLSEKELSELTIVTKGNHARYGFRVLSSPTGPNRAMRRYNDKIRRQRRKRVLANIKKLIRKEQENADVQQ